jgi:hypothetical protein
MGAFADPALENPYAGQGMVLLDIGGDVGAVVVEVPDELVGMEVEIRPDGREHEAHAHGHDDGAAGHHHPHVAVVRRPVAGGSVASLVFPEVTGGRYHLAEKHLAEPVLVVDVRGGEVTTSVWPSVTGG